MCPTPARFCEAGYEVTVSSNQGAGALRRRARRHVGYSLGLDQQATTGDRMRWAHIMRRQSPGSRHGLRPEHDWASHGADMVDGAASPTKNRGKTDYSKLDTPPNGALRA